MARVMDSCICVTLKPSSMTCSATNADTPFAQTTNCNVLSLHLAEGFSRKIWLHLSEAVSGRPWSRQTTNAADSTIARPFRFSSLIDAGSGGASMIQQTSDTPVKEATAGMAS